MIRYHPSIEHYGPAPQAFMQPHAHGQYYNRHEVDEIIGVLANALRQISSDCSYCPVALAEDALKKAGLDPSDGDVTRTAQPRGRSAAPRSSP